MQIFCKLIGDALSTKCYSRRKPQAREGILQPSTRNFRQNRLLLLIRNQAPYQAGKTFKIDRGIISIRTAPAIPRLHRRIPQAFPFTGTIISNQMLLAILIRKLKE